MLANRVHKISVWVFVPLLFLVVAFGLFAVVNKVVEILFHGSALFTAPFTTHLVIASGALGMLTYLLLMVVTSFKKATNPGGGGFFRGIGTFFLWLMKSPIFFAEMLFDDPSGATKK